MDKVVQKVRETITRHQMIPEGGVVCVALSGGPDSTALLAILHKLAPHLGFSVKTCHFDHAFRDDSDKDETFARQTAEKIEAPFISERNNDGKPASGAQEKGRKMRYRFFDRLKEERYCDIIATGHTKDDSVETSLMWMLRGAGPSAFGGIAPVRDIYIRPLIDVSKAWILRWLDTTGVEFSADPTNETDLYMRNRIRRRLIPVMKGLSKGSIDSVARLALLCREQGKVITSIAERKFPSVVLRSDVSNKVTLIPDLLFCEPAAIRYEIYRQAITKAGFDPSVMSMERIEAIDNMLANNRLGRVIEGPGGIVIRLDHAGLSIGADIQVDRITASPFSCPMTVTTSAGTLMVTNGGVSEGITIDTRKIPEETQVRGRREGDFLYLPNSKKRKKLKKLLIEKKVPRPSRDAIPLVASGSRVLYVAGLYIDTEIITATDPENLVSLNFIPYTV